MLGLGRRWQDSGEVGMEHGVPQDALNLGPEVTAKRGRCHGYAKQSHPIESLLPLTEHWAA